MTRSRPWLLAVLLLAGSLAFAAPATTQWLEAPAEGWIDVTIYHHDTRSRFDYSREESPIQNQGHAVATSLFLTGAVGLVRGIDLWLQLPYHRLRFDDAARDRVSHGIGDPRVFLRMGPAALGLPDMPVAVRAGYKSPQGDFDVDAEVIPLGEGQRDLELLVELGHSFYPRPIWAMGWVGYRWREENTVLAREPGNERFWHAAAGVEWQGVNWKGVVEGSKGHPWRIQNIRVPTSSREIVQGLFSGSVPVGPGDAGAGVRVPFRGRNLPSGPAFFMSYFLRIGG